MFKIDANKTIYLTRGDIATINVSAKNSDGSAYTFKAGDVLRLNIFNKAECNTILLTKDIEIAEDTTVANIPLNSAETKFGEAINKPVEYWYEIVLNPETGAQTIVGYLDTPTVFKILPEGIDG